MKKLIYIIAISLISNFSFAQNNKWEVNVTANTSVTGAVDNWMYAPQLQVSYNGFGLTASPLYQDAALYNESGNLKEVGYELGVQKIFAFDCARKTKKSGLYLFYNYINRQTVTDYRLQYQLDQKDYNTGKKEYSIAEHYAGFGVNLAVTERLYFDSSLGFGYYQTSEHTEYNIDLEPFKYSASDVALKLEAGIGFLIFKR